MKTLEVGYFKLLSFIRKTSLLGVLATGHLFSQEIGQSKDSLLRATITPERQWWDLDHYHLDLTVDTDKKFIRGKNTIQYKVMERKKVMQIDLQPPLKIDKITQGEKVLDVERVGTNAYFVKLKKRQRKGTLNKITVHYSGHPRKAVRPPWDGGFSWEEDSNGKPFVATSCQFFGASVWWPCKDHMYDEVDSMHISVTFPKDLMNISNGRLKHVETHNKWKTTHWFVANPINSYGVNVNIGDYINFGEVYKGEKGSLDISYWVLRENKKRAREQFKQVPKMLGAFEYWFGPYPFYEDGFKVVDVPYLGMEHQSSITYGNGYQNGYLGTDLSKSGWGLKFDYILIHEAGHEWFANNITYKGVADLWIHESFTSYSESLYIEYHFGKIAGQEYIIGTRELIGNDTPIIYPYGPKRPGSLDVTYKGANMLHTLRQLIENDEEWRQILRGMNKDFYHQTVTSEEIEAYLSNKTGKDLTAFFNQYLRSVNIPTLEYDFDGQQFKYRYTGVVPGFDMPLRVFIDDKPRWIFPNKNEKWKIENIKGRNIRIDENFYIDSKKI